MGRRAVSMVTGLAALARGSDWLPVSVWQVTTSVSPVPGDLTSPSGPWRHCTDINEGKILTKIK